MIRPPSILLLGPAFLLAPCPSDVDNDADGFTVADGDCADMDPEIHPGATEYCDGGMDEDCDGLAEESECWSVRYTADGMVPDDRRYGRYLAGVGDQDGDGIGDLVVGDDQYDPPECGGADCDYGAVYVLSGAHRGDSRAQAAVATITGVENMLQLGMVIAGGGDLNGDGVGDLVATTSGDLGSGSNHIYAFYGPVQGARTIGSADSRIDGSYDCGTSPGTLSMRGDLNGDGYDDLVVGSPNSDLFPESSTSGEVFIFNGPLPTSGYAPTVASARIRPESGTTSQMGMGVSSAGDVNGDGYDDLVVGSFGGAWFFYGPLTGSVLDTEADAAVLARGSLSSNPGMGVAILEDMNNDGYDEVAIGDPYGNSPTGDYASGLVHVFYGPVGGELDLDLADFTLVGPLRGYIGFSMASPGDVNGDGRGDLLMGYLHQDTQGLDVSAAYLLTATPVGVHYAVDVAIGLLPQLPSTDSGFAPAIVGYPAFMGDIDRDGRDDIGFGGYLDATAPWIYGAFVRVGWTGVW